MFSMSLEPEPLRRSGWMSASARGPPAFRSACRRSISGSSFRSPAAAHLPPARRPGGDPQRKKERRDARIQLIHRVDLAGCSPAGSRSIRKMKAGLARIRLEAHPDPGLETLPPPPRPPGRSPMIPPGPLRGHRPPVTPPRAKPLHEMDSARGASSVREWRACTREIRRRASVSDTPTASWGPEMVMFHMWGSFVTPYPLAFFPPRRPATKRWRPQAGPSRAPRSAGGRPPTPCAARRARRLGSVRSGNAAPPFPAGQPPLEAEEGHLLLLYGEVDVLFEVGLLVPERVLHLEGYRLPSARGSGGSPPARPGAEGGALHMIPVLLGDQGGLAEVTWVAGGPAFPHRDAG